MGGEGERKEEIVAPEVWRGKKKENRRQSHA